MVIQWFPGHMTKSLRMMEENVKLVDAMVYVLDARAVKACVNPAFRRIIGNKPVLYVLNKADLADERATKAWQSEFIRQGKNVLVLNGTQTAAASQISAKLNKMLSERLQRDREKGMTRSVRAMVIGIPNCGKSTIINSLCGSKRAETGDKAGVTRNKQWVRAGEFLEVMDTPGTLCPAFENQTEARHLAYIGSINDDILDKEDLCLELISELKTLAPQSLTERYRVSELSDTPLENYEAICKARGFVIRGGDFDYSRCANAVLDDLRKGKLGRISFETPEVFHAEL